MTRRIIMLATTVWSSIFAQGVKQLSPAEIEDALENRKVFFLDVREPKELSDLGTVQGYVNIPLGQLESRLKEIPKDRLVLTA